MCCITRIQTKSISVQICTIESGDMIRSRVINLNKCTLHIFYILEPLPLDHSKQKRLIYLEHWNRPK